MMIYGLAAFLDKTVALKTAGINRGIPGVVKHIEQGKDGGMVGLWLSGGSIFGEFHKAGFPVNTSPALFIPTEQLEWLTVSEV